MAPHEYAKSNREGLGSFSVQLIMRAQGKVQQWQGPAWVGGEGGAINNIPVWEELLEKLNDRTKSSGGSMCWVMWETRATK